MRWCHASRAVVLAVLLAGVEALFPAHTGAQTPTFTVEGVITDEQQAVLPGATVTIRNIATNLIAHRRHRRRAAATSSPRCRPRAATRSPSS